MKDRPIWFDDDDSTTPENPLRLATVRNVGLIKSDEESQMDERLENPVIDNIPPRLDQLTVGELREVLKQLPPYLRRGRKVSAYNVYLGKCLTGSKLEPDITTSEHVRQCNLSWRDLPEAEKELYRQLASEKNEE